ncbi:cytochrome P450 [Nocardia wallacei]|uniref:cytochrome P450 n=1 Tax=Nocardia wallacei TaxID=480035 RepID=UPI00245750AC|nr:cytochrome P450 [Nocardia wallacei]
MDNFSRLLRLDSNAVRHPYDIYAELRHRRPAFFESESQVYVVSRYNDIVDVLRDTSTYSSHAAVGPGLGESMQNLLTGLDEEEADYLLLPIGIVTASGPEHARFRRLTNGFFTPRAVRRLAPGMRRLCAETLGRLPGAATVDVMAEFSRPFAVSVIADIVGVSTEDRSMFYRWSEQAAELVNGSAVTLETIHEYLRSAREFVPYFSRQIEIFRRSPSDCLLSEVAKLNDDGEALANRDLIQLMVFILTAGIDTATNFVTNCLWQLAENRTTADRLRSHPDEVDGFVEEVARLHSAVQAMFRTATRDTELAGVWIPAGSHLYLLYASGSRDETVFEHPDSLNFGCPKTGHLGFGHGAHFCLGANVARTEAAIAIESFLERYEAIELVQPEETLPYRPHLLGAALRTLPLSLA